MTATQDVTTPPKLDDQAARHDRDPGRRALARLQVGRSGWLTLALTAVLLVIAAALSSVLIASTGGSPVDALDAIWNGSLANSAGWSTTLLNAAPLLLVAAGTCVCATAGTFNIGQEGQVLIGGLAGAWAGLRLALPGPWLVVVVLLFAAAGGALWAFLSALAYRFRNVNVAVSTLLMTFVAIQLVDYAVSQQSLLQETAQGSSGIASNVSNPLPKAGQLATFGQYPDLQLNTGLFIALLGAIGAGVILTRSRWGFRLRMTGLNPLTARHAGVRVAALSGLALAISGAFAGLAGGVLLTSPIGTNRMQAGLSDNVGWDGLLVALVARNRPVVAIPVAVVFGVLRAGGDFLSSNGLPYFLVDVIKSLLVLAFVAPPVLVGSWLARRAGRVPAVATAGVPTSKEVAA
ncbi:ABC transporter permease [Jatrophihabitans fulvus]